jgi:hypothetical protein
MLAFPQDLVKSDIESDITVYLLPNDPAGTITEAKTAIHEGLVYAEWGKENRIRLADCARDITWFTDRVTAVTTANLVRTQTILAYIDKARALSALPPIE